PWRHPVKMRLYVVGEFSTVGKEFLQILALQVSIPFRHLREVPLALTEREGGIFSGGEPITDKFGKGMEPFVDGRVFVPRPLRYCDRSTRPSTNGSMPLPNLSVIGSPPEKMPPSRSVRARGTSRRWRRDAYLKREDLQKLFTYCGELTDHVQAHFYRMYMAALKNRRRTSTASMSWTASTEAGGGRLRPRVSGAAAP
ncbi:hypothetical protein ABMX48_36350, partial [Streptomyces cavourensis]